MVVSQEGGEERSCVVVVEAVGGDLAGLLAVGTKLMVLSFRRAGEKKFSKREGD